MYTVYSVNQTNRLKGCNMFTDVEVNKDQLIDRFIAMGYEIDVSISIVNNMIGTNPLSAILLTEYDQLLDALESK